MERKEAEKKVRKREIYKGRNNQLTKTNLRDRRPSLPWINKSGFEEREAGREGEKICSAPHTMLNPACTLPHHTSQLIPPPVFFSLRLSVAFSGITMEADILHAK